VELFLIPNKQNILGYIIVTNQNLSKPSDYILIVPGNKMT